MIKPRPHSGGPPCAHFKHRPPGERSPAVWRSVCLHLPLALPHANVGLCVLCASVVHLQVGSGWSVASRRRFSLLPVGYRAERGLAIIRSLRLFRNLINAGSARRRKVSAMIPRMPPTTPMPATATSSGQNGKATEQFTTESPTHSGPPHGGRRRGTEGRCMGGWQRRNWRGGFWRAGWRFGFRCSCTRFCGRNAAATF